VLDMATSTVTWGHLLVAARREQEVAAGVAIDADGCPTTSATAALHGGALLPLGGLEQTGGYKGYGLALVVDVLTGVLAAANFGSRVVPFSLTEGPSNLGQLFLAIDPDVLEPGFEARLEALLDELVQAPTAPGAPGPIVIPGQPEAEREQEQRRGGIILDRAHHGLLVALADRFDIAFPSVGSATPGDEPTE
jgi:LDH2 family malate/lactate/ureidoglycolate dehydrogenase